MGDDESKQKTKTKTLPLVGDEKKELFTLRREMSTELTIQLEAEDKNIVHCLS